MSDLLDNVKAALAEHGQHVDGYEYNGEKVLADLRWLAAEVEQLRLENMDLLIRHKNCQPHCQYFALEADLAAMTIERDALRTAIEQDAPKREQMEAENASLRLNNIILCDDAKELDALRQRHAEAVERMWLITEWISNHRHTIASMEIHEKLSVWIQAESVGQKT